jgi:hypothetical protein
VVEQLLRKTRVFVMEGFGGHKINITNLSAVFFSSHGNGINQTQFFNKLSFDFKKE